MRTALIATLFFLTASAASAVTIYVPDDHLTIQGAITASTDGDSVIVRPGTYAEAIDFLGKAITLQSEQGPDVTTIDATTVYDRVVTFVNGEGPDSRLEGFTLTGGWVYPSGGGGGILCSDASPTIVDNVVDDNYSTGPGGGISVTGASAAPLIEGNTISNNSSGIGVYSGATPTILRNTISDNGWSGIEMRDSSPIIQENLITRNDGSYGAGIWVRYNSEPVIEGNTISDNVALQVGGGICVGEDNGSPYAHILNNTITGNSAGTSGGGGIAVDAYGSGGSASADIIGNTISDNWTSSFWGSGGGIYAYVATLLVEDNVISGNQAQAGGGGGIWMRETAADIINNRITDNQITTDAQGAGIYYMDGAATMSGNVIAYNTTLGDGGGVYIRTGSGIDFTNNTVYGNSASTGLGLYLYGASVLDIYNSIFWDHSGLDIRLYSTSGNFSCYITSTVVEGGAGSIDNDGGGTLTLGDIYDFDPELVDPAGEDYHLTFASPARDLGDDSAPGIPSADFEGDPRSVLSSVDIGADEFYFHLYHTGDVIPGAQIDLRVVGGPGMPVLLAMGSGIQDPPLPTQYGDLYLPYPFMGMWTLPPIPGSGVLILPVTVPAFWNPGEEYPFQALVGPMGGPLTHLTNLMVLTVE